MAARGWWETGGGLLSIVAALAQCLFLCEARAGLLFRTETINTAVCATTVMESLDGKQTVGSLKCVHMCVGNFSYDRREAS